MTKAQEKNKMQENKLYIFLKDAEAAATNFATFFCYCKLLISLMLLQKNKSQNVL